MQKLIYIIRHGETEYNRLGKVQGSGVDTDLNDLGRAQAAAFYQQYAEVPFQAIITSTLKRTWQTVAPFIAEDIPWTKDANLNEVCWGVQEGQTSTEESRLMYRKVVGAWKTGDYSACMEEGESAAEFGQRLQTFVNSLKNRPEDHILVCSHGRAMRALMCLLQDEPLSKMQDYQHNNTGLWTFQFDGSRFHTILQNDLTHLDHLVPLTT